MPTFDGGVLLGVLPTGDTGLPGAAPTLGAEERHDLVEQLHGSARQQEATTHTTKPMRTKQPRLPIVSGQLVGPSLTCHLGGHSPGAAPA
jgi:hypothetical protein